MERGWLMALALGAWSAGLAGGQAARRLAAGYVVDRLVETRAVVVPLAGGPAQLLHRAALPEEVREGDVIIDGRVSLDSRAALERRSRAVLAAPLEGSFDLEDAPGCTWALTAGGEC